MIAIEELEDRVGELGSVLVAFSGGVDSSLVAALAVRALGDRALAVTAVSPALASGEAEDARAVARSLGIQHETISTQELARSEYVRNDRWRCYHCKTELYQRLQPLAEQRNLATVVSGANADDPGDWRPGLRAAGERAVRHPLLEAGVSKADVRRLARALRIPSARKPASPCLASRLPYGTPVTREALARVDAAEQALKTLGYRELRVRHFGVVGKVQIAGDELVRASSPEGRTAVVRAVQQAGYSKVVIDDRPLRSGSLNFES